MVPPLPWTAIETSPLSVSPSAQTSFWDGLLPVGRGTGCSGLPETVLKRWRGGTGVRMEVIACGMPSAAWQQYAGERAGLLGGVGAGGLKPTVTRFAHSFSAQLKNTFKRVFRWLGPPNPLNCESSVLHTYQSSPSGSEFSPTR